MRTFLVGLASLTLAAAAPQNSPGYAGDGHGGVPANTGLVGKKTGGDVEVAVMDMEMAQVVVASAVVRYAVDSLVCHSVAN